jgi:hypothetical protein
MVIIPRRKNAVSSCCGAFPASARSRAFDSLRGEPGEPAMRLSPAMRRRSRAAQASARKLAQRVSGAQRQGGAGEDGIALSRAGAGGAPGTSGRYPTPPPLWPFLATEAVLSPRPPRRGHGKPQPGGDHRQCLRADRIGDSDEYSFFRAPEARDLTTAASLPEDACEGSLGPENFRNTLVREKAKDNLTVFIEPQNARRGAGPRLLHGPRAWESRRWTPL